MKKLLLTLLYLCSLQFVHAQVGYGTNNPDPRSVIELSATDKAFYPPRLTDSQISAQSGWKSGMLLYNTTKNCLYQRNDTGWVCLDYVGNWKLSGNSGTDSSNFIGTTDSTDLIFRTNNLEQMRIKSDGKIGVGVDSPTENLDIDGKLRVRTMDVASTLDTLVHLDQGVLQKATPENVNLPVSRFINHQNAGVKTYTVTTTNNRIGAYRVYLVVYNTICTPINRKYYYAFDVYPSNMIAVSEMRGPDTVTKNNNSSVTVKHNHSCSNSSAQYINDIVLTVSNNSKTLEVKNLTSNGYERYLVTWAF